MDRMNSGIDEKLLKEAIGKQKDVIDKSSCQLKFEPIVKQSLGFFSDVPENSNDILLRDKDRAILCSDECPIELLVYATLEAVINQDIDVDSLQRKLLDDYLGVQND